MAASYPTSVKTWTPVADSTDTIDAAHVNELYEEVIAVETDLKNGNYQPVGNELTALQALADTAGLVKKTGDGAYEIKVMGDWVEPSLENSWINNASHYNVAYKNDGLGFIHLRGLTTSGTIGANLFTLPSGCRPSKRCYLGAVGYISGGVQICRVSIEADGTLQISTGLNNWVSLEGLSFPL